MWKQLAVAFAVLSLGCVCMPGGGGTCSVSDKRFSCAGEPAKEGVKVSFSDAPSGGYYVSSSNLGFGQADSVECHTKGGNFPTKGSTIVFDCSPKEAGEHTLYFEIKHTEMPSYVPVPGETCLKSATQWSCTTRGHLTFTSDGSSGDSARTTSTLQIPKDEDACVAAGGKWGKVGLYPKEICNMPTNDGGNVCRDDSDCAGSCLSEDEDATSGKCTEWTTVVGCHYQVENGRVMGKLCRD